KGAGDLRLGIGQAPALVEELAPVEAGGEVAVGETEPARRPEPAQPLEDREAVVLQAPAALLVDFAAQPVGDEVGIGGDVDAERLDVVAGVGDHAELGAELLLHAGGELGTTSTSSEQGYAHRQNKDSRFARCAKNQICTLARSALIASGRRRAARSA